MVRIYAIIFLLIFQVNYSFSQAAKKYPGGYFRSPLDIPLKLSGTFGELRTDHFHSGIDIKTNGLQGARVYAIADGYISRIKVSPTGFGKALYITHPNGYVSVYAHLKGFTPEVNAYVKKKQYENRTFALNLFPKPDMFKVTKGQIIAISGNSGGSEGPHLHFEVRDAKTEKPVNPLYFGFHVEDQVKPSIRAIKIYPVNNASRVNDSLTPQTFQVERFDQNYRLKNHDTILVTGTFYLGIRTYDMFSQTPNKNGAYQVELFYDTTKVYSHTMATFSFNESRYINSLIDYEEFIGSGKRYQKSYIQPNNKLSIYNHVLNDGAIKVEDTLVHKATYQVSDLHGNLSQLSFYVKGYVMDSSKVKNRKHTGQLFRYNDSNQFTTNLLSVSAPKNAFYDSFYFCYDTLTRSEGIYSEIHLVHQKNTPIHRWLELKIRPTYLPENLYDKALIVELAGEKTISAGGKYEDGFIETQIRSFGKYAVGVDTLPPEINPVNIHSGKNIQAYKYIKIKIKDGQSGIKSYEGSLNNSWILMEYDPKNDWVVYTVDDKMRKGLNEFRLEVVDNKDNISIYEAKLNY